MPNPFTDCFVAFVKECFTLQLSWIPGQEMNGHWKVVQINPKSVDPQKVLNKQEELGSQSEKQIFQGSFCVGPELASPRRSQRDTVRAATHLSDLQLAVAWCTSKANSKCAMVGLFSWSSYFTHCTLLTVLWSRTLLAELYSRVYFTHRVTTLLTESLLYSPE